MTINGSTTNYTYDAAGNLTAEGSTTYTYDAAGRLKEVGTGGQNVYGFDGDGKRVKKIENGAAAVYCVYSTTTGQSMLEVNAASWTPYRAYVISGSQVVAQQSHDGNFYWLHQDHLGSARKLTNTAGTEVYRGEFDPHGQVLLETGSLALNNKKFTGYERDATGLDYAQARMYHHNRGRFIQPDPGWLNAASAAKPQTLNRYSYADHDPVNKVDPSGLDPILAIIGVSMIFNSLPIIKDSVTIVAPPDTITLNEGYFFSDLFGPISESNSGGGGNLPIFTVDWAAIFRELAVAQAIEFAKQRLATDGCKELFGQTDASALLDAYVRNGLIAINNKYPDKPLVGPDVLVDYRPQDIAVTSTVSGRVPGDIYGILRRGSPDNSNAFNLQQINIRANGTFFSNQVGIAGAATKVGVTANTYTERAAVIIHELAHIAKVIPSDADDSTNEANSMKVFEKCFK